MTAVEKLEKLQSKYKVRTNYSVGFNQEISPAVLEVIKHLKGDLHPEDIVPEHPTSLSITVLDEDKILGHYYLDSTTYMAAFDLNSYDTFMDELLSSAENI